MKESRRLSRRDSQTVKKRSGWVCRKEGKCEREPSGFPFAFNDPPQRSKLQNKATTNDFAILQLVKKVRQGFFGKINAYHSDGNDTQIYLPWLDSTFNLIGTEASCTDVYMAGRTVDDCFYALHVGRPGSVGTSVRVGNLNPESNFFVADITFSHGLHLLLFISDLSDHIATTIITD